MRKILFTLALLAMVGSMMTSVVAASTQVHLKKGLLDELPMDLEVMIVLDNSSGDLNGVEGTEIYEGMTVVRLGFRNNKNFGPQYVSTDLGIHISDYILYYLIDGIRHDLSQSKTGSDIGLVGVEGGGTVNHQLNNLIVPDDPIPDPPDEPDPPDDPVPDPPDEPDSPSDPTPETQDDSEAVTTAGNDDEVENEEETITLIPELPLPESEPDIFDEELPEAVIFDEDLPQTGAIPIELSLITGFVLTGMGIFKKFRVQGPKKQ